MTQRVIEDFSGGTPGQEVPNFTALAGSLLLYAAGDIATAQDSQATLLRYEDFAGTSECRARTKVKFASPGTGDWWVSVVLIVDGDNYYEARLRTNNNSPPQVSIWKILDGVAYDIMAEVNGPVLAAGTFVTLELYRLGSTLRLLVDDTQYGTDVTDDAFTANWRTGYRYQYYSSGAWHVDDLEILDHTTEPSASGRILQVGTDSYDEDGMADANIELVRLVTSYLSPKELVFREHCAHTAASFRPEQEVYLLQGSPRETDFRGLIKRVRRVATAEAGEAVDYVCYGPRFQAKYVTPEHPDTKAFSIVWNADEDDDDYDADYAGKSIGEIVKWYFDQNTTALRQQKAAPNTAIYESSDFSGMSVIPTKMSLRGDFETILQTLLGYQPTYAILIDHDTGKWRFVDWTGHSGVDLSWTSLVTPTNEVADDSTRIYTAVRVRSVRREKKTLSGSTIQKTLLPYWDKGLEPYWSPVYENRSELVCTVSQAISDNEVELAISHTQDKAFLNEWKNTTLRFDTGDLIDETYAVLSNTVSKGGKFNVVISGTFSSAPSAGDQVTLTDSKLYATTTDWNGMKKVFRAYIPADNGSRDAFGKACATATIVTRAFDGSGQVDKMPTDVEFDFKTGAMMIGVAAVATPTNQKGAACNTPGDYQAADVEYEGEFWSTEVLERRYPTSGWHGTGYSDDEARWDGGGPPSPTDWGVMREKLIEDPNYISVLQNDDMDTMLEEWLQSRCNKPFEGRHEYRGSDTDGIDRTFVNLQKAVTFSSASRTTGWESSVYIFAHTVVFDFARDLTVLELGSQSTFSNAEYERLRDAMVKQAREGDWERQLRTLMEQQQCQRDRVTKVGHKMTGPICGEQVRVKKGRDGDDRKGGSNLKKELNKLKQRVKDLEDNKDETEERRKKEDDSSDQGHTFLIDGDGDAWASDLDGNWRSVELDASGDPVLTTAGDLTLGDPGEPAAGPAVHKHIEAYEETLWDGAQDTWPLPFTPRTDDPPIVFLRSGGSGTFDYQRRPQDYTISGNTLTFVTPPASGSATKIHAETGIVLIRRQCRVRVDLAQEIQQERKVLVDLVSA